MVQVFSEIQHHLYSFEETKYEKTQKVDDKWKRGTLKCYHFHGSLKHDFPVMQYGWLAGHPQHTNCPFQQSTFDVIWRLS